MDKIKQKAQAAAKVVKDNRGKIVFAGTVVVMMAAGVKMMGAQDRLFKDFLDAQDPELYDKFMLHIMSEN